MKPRPLVELLRKTFDLVYAILTRPRFFGQANIPEQGPFLIVTNHMSYADPPLIFIAVRRAGMVAIVADTYKANPFYRWLIDTIGGVWIKRGAGDRPALRAAIDVLKKGYILGMAPEGTRSKTKQLLTAKHGAAFIAASAGVPLLPVGLTGTENVFAEMKRLRRAEVAFRAGVPFTLPPLDPENRARSLDEHTREIMCRIAALLPEKYHGAYAGDPRIEEVRKLNEQ